MSMHASWVEIKTSSASPLFPASDCPKKNWTACDAIYSSKRITDRIVNNIKE